MEKNQQMMIKRTHDPKPQQNQNPTIKTKINMTTNIKFNNKLESDLERCEIIRSELVNLKKHVVWDCGSSLYDSFELKSFEKQLYSAINSRTLSMPHLPDRKPVMSQTPRPPASNSKKQAASTSSSSNKFARSLHKFIKSMFTVKVSRPDQHKTRDRHEHYHHVIYDKSGALTTIPEVPEIDHLGGFSPEISSLVRRTGSERFTAATSIGISCA